MYIDIYIHPPRYSTLPLHSFVYVFTANPISSMETIWLLYTDTELYNQKIFTREINTKINLWNCHPPSSATLPTSVAVVTSVASPAIASSAAAAAVAAADVIHQCYVKQFLCCCNVLCFGDIRLTPRITSPVNKTASPELAMANMFCL